MLRRFVLMLTAAAGWFLLTGTNAHAGLITESAAQGSVWQSAGVGESTPAETPRPRSFFDRLQADDALFELSPANSSMSGHSVNNSSSSSPPATLPETSPQLHSHLVLWVSPDNYLWTPPPFLSGIFRPPRFV